MRLILTQLFVRQFRIIASSLVLGTFLLLFLLLVLGIIHSVQATSYAQQLKYESITLSSNLSQTGQVSKLATTISLTPTVSHEVYSDGTVDPSTPGQVFAFNVGFPDSASIEHRGVVVYQLPPLPAGMTVTDISFSAQQATDIANPATWDGELHALEIRSSSLVTATDFSAPSTLIQANYLDHNNTDLFFMDLSANGKNNLIDYLNTNYVDNDYLFLRLQPPDGTSPVVGQRFHVPMPGHFNTTRHPQMFITFGASYQVYIPLVQTPSLDTSQWYRLTNQFLSDKSLDMPNDGSNAYPVLRDTSNFSGQFWKLTDLGNGSYRLTNRFLGDNKSLDLPNDGIYDPIMADTANVTGQFWYFTPIGNGYYRLNTEFLGSGKSLDVPNDGVNERPVMRDSGNFSGQYWQLIPLGVIN